MEFTETVYLEEETGTINMHLISSVLIPDFPLKVS